MDEDKLLYSEIREEIPKIELLWSDLYFSVQNKVQTLPILKGVSGEAKPGEFLAIMGSSGAGKTTLLNLLSNRVQKTKYLQYSGEIFANNQNITEIAYTNYIGYVTQEDIILESLTVKESLMFSGRLRVKASYESISQKVDKLIKELKLENCANTLIGDHMMKGISGGERKRTSIGIELITDPSIIFLDEPTSGLDSFTASIVINLLLLQAKKGRTVISTIHQPSSDIFHMFDKLLLMSDGYILFHGKATDCISFFSRLGFSCPPLSNPSDYFIEILHINKPHNLSEEEKRRVQIFTEAYKISSLVKRSNSFEMQKLETSKIMRKTNFLFQVYMNLYRFNLRLLRNPMLTFVKLFIMTFIAIMINIFYFQLGTNADSIRNRNGVLFFITINFVMANLQTSILSFPIMRSLLIKEYNSNMYGVTAFFIARNLNDFLLDLIVTVYFGNIVYWAVGLNPGFSNYVNFLLIGLLVHMAGGSLGFFCGSLFKRGDVAMSFTAISMLPFLYFSGFYRNKNIPNAFA